MNRMVWINSSSEGPWMRSEALIPPFKDPKPAILTRQTSKILDEGRLPMVQCTDLEEIGLNCRDGKGTSSERLTSTSRQPWGFPSLPCDESHSPVKVCGPAPRLARLDANRIGILLVLYLRCRQTTRRFDDLRASAWQTFDAQGWIRRVSNRLCALDDVSWPTQNVLVWGRPPRSDGEKGGVWRARELGHDWVSGHLSIWGMAWQRTATGFGEGLE